MKINSYLMPQHVANATQAILPNKDAEILDFGAGTGLLAVTVSNCFLQSVTTGHTVNLSCS